MQVSFYHYHGTQEQFDLCCYRAELDCEPDEQAAALALGWLLHDGRWYQSRSTRLACDAYDWPAETTVYSFDIETEYSSELKVIWSDYLEHKGFAEQYDPGHADPHGFWLVARDCQQTAVGFTKMRAYQGGLESQYNAYVQQAVNLGRIMIDHEVALAKKQGLSYLYTGSGYEQSSAYKAHLPGFEWWTGSVWSRERKTYLNLCQRDSKVNGLAELAQAYNNG
jgi:hypothetical protein